MKGFVRENTRFSLCGLNCALCVMRMDGHCPGCGGGAGNQSCAIARCGMAHGVAYCVDCAAYPCARLEDAQAYDSFISSLHSREDMARMRVMGEAAYSQELDERMAVYRALEAGYNDGRRKTLFRQAVNLLPVEDVRAILPSLEAQAREGEDAKSRAVRAASWIEDLAKRRGISLKLRKKPAQPSHAPEG